MVGQGPIQFLQGPHHLSNQLFKDSISLFQNDLGHVNLFCESVLNSFKCAYIFNGEIWPLVYIIHHKHGSLWSLTCQAFSPVCLPTSLTSKGLSRQGHTWSLSDPLHHSLLDGCTPGRTSDWQPPGGSWGFHFSCPKEPSCNCPPLGG